MKRHTLWLPALALTTTIMMLAYAARKPEPSQTTLENVRTEARGGGYRLITTEKLWSWFQADSKDLLIVDTRQEWEYRTGHIRGAINFPMEPTWLSRWRKKNALAQLLGEDKSRTIVFYWAGLAWVRSDSAARVAVQLGYQKVYRDPLGYPQWLDRGLPVEKTSYSVHPVPSPTSTKRRTLEGWGLLWTLLGVFAGGMALNLTPCVYPIIPVTISYFAGQSDRRQSRLFAHGASYVIGLAVSNSLLGVTAALTGGLMGALLQNPVVLIAIATVLVLFAASLFGFWEMRLPYAMTQVASHGYAGYFGSLFMGLTMGVVAAPCIGPFALGLLTWVAGLGSAWLGFVVFFTLSLGLGLPLFILALFSGQLKRLPRSGEWMLWVRKMMAWVLVAMAAYYLRALLPKSGYTFLLASVALSAGLHLGWIAKVQDQSNRFTWIRAVAGTVGLVLATLLIGNWVLRGPGITWQPYSDDLLETAHRVGKPVIVDFYADWCSPCVKLEDETFHQSAIVTRARKDFIMVKVDLTRAENALTEFLLKRYNVKGVPTIVFIGPDGRERDDLRLVDFLPADQFLNRMRSLTQPNSGG